MDEVIQSIILVGLFLKLLKPFLNIFMNIEILSKTIVGNWKWNCVNVHFPLRGYGTLPYCDVHILSIETNNK